LIVDDSRTAREALRRMLADHELHVETAESAEAALEFLAVHRPDVIFMDHMMPGMDGFQAVKAIKENPATATIPVMMYTSQSGELYVGQARALGALSDTAETDQAVEVGGAALTAPARVMPRPFPHAGRRPTGLQGESVNAPAGGPIAAGCRKCWLTTTGAARPDVETTVSRVLGEHLPNSGR
jgi:CheY-like chemotaxis protein